MDDRLYMDVYIALRRNLCAFEEGNMNQFIQDRAIENFGVTVEPVELGQMSLFTFTATNGTDVTLFCDYGDVYDGASGLTIEEDWFADMLNTRQFNITYTQAGNFNVTCWASNDRSYIVVSVDACVDIPIAGELTGSDTILSADTRTILFMAYTAGTFLVLSLDIGDGEVVTTYEYDNFTMVPTHIEYLYHQLGRYYVNASMCNCVSCVANQLTINVGLPITSSEYTTTSPTLLGDVTNFTATLSNSSETSCVFTFDDGFYMCFYELFTETPFVAEWNYTTAGLFNTTLFCENWFGNVTYSEQVNVAEAIVNLTANTTHVIIADAGDAYVSATVDAGTGITFIAECDGAQCGVLALPDSKTVTVTVSDSKLPDYGDVNLTIVATNAVGSESVEITLSVDQTITGAAFLNQQMYVKTNENLVIPVSCTTGSRINYQLKPGDDVTILTLFFTTDEHSTSFVNSWVNPGFYQITFTAINNISSDITVASVGVENPVPPIADITISSTNVQDVSNEVVITAALGTGTAVPTSVELEIDFGDNSSNVTVAATLTTAGDGADVTVGHTYTHFGDYLVSGVFRNNVSNESFSNQPVRVGIPITGLTLTSSPLTAAVGDTITFTLHVGAGSNVSHILNLGDGQSATLGRTTSNWYSSDDKTYTYEYTAANTAYAPNLTSSNAFGTIGPIHLVNNETILIQGVMPDLNLSTEAFQHDDATDINIYLAKLNTADAGPSAPVTCTWSQDNVAQNPTKNADLLATDSSNTPFVLLDAMSAAGTMSVGDHTTTVNCSNAVSWKTASASFRVEKSITGQSIAPAVAAVAVGHSAVFTQAVTAGSHVNFTTDFGDNTSPILTTHTDPLDSTSTVEVQHDYATSGNRTVTLVAENDISSETTTTSIIVQRPIPDGITLTHNAFAKPGSEAVDITITVPAGVTLDDAFFELDPGDGGAIIQLFGGDMEESETLSTQYTFVANSAPPDSTPTTLNISNLVNYKIVEKTIKLENPLVGLSFILKRHNVAFIAVKTNDDVTLDFNTTGGTDITFVGAYGDSTSNDTFTASGEGTSHQFTHAFTQAGTYHVIGWAANHVSEETTSRSCKVENPVLPEDLAITLKDSDADVTDKTVVKNGVGGTLDITFSIASVAVHPTDVSVNISFQHGAEAVNYVIASFPKTITTPEYTVSGDFVITTITYNNVSSVTRSHSIQVQEMLQQPTISFQDNPVIFQHPLENLMVTVESGTHYTILTDFIDGKTKNFTVENVPGAHTFNFSGHLYIQPGPYELTVRAWNAFDDLTQTKNIMILSDLPNMTLETNSPMEMSASNNPVGHFRLIIAPEYKAKVDCKVHFDPGDKTALQILDRSMIDDIVITHTYDADGYFTVKINVTTSFDYKYYQTTMSVQERISEVTIVITEAEHDKEEGTYYVGTSLTFMFAYAKGTGANHTVTVTNTATNAPSETKMTLQKQMLWTMGLPGEFTIDVVVDNAIGNAAADGLHPRKASGKVTIKPRGIIALFNYPPVVNAGESMAFTLQFAAGYSLTDMCVKLKLGNRFVWYALVTRYCTELNDPDFQATEHTVKIHDGSSMLNIEDIKFNEAGMTDIYVKVSYVYASTEQFNMVEGFVNVTVYCYPPVVRLKYPATLLRAFRAKQIHVGLDNFILETKCIATTQVHTFFEIGIFDNYTTKEQGDDVTDVIQSELKADGFYIEPLQLTVGYYYVRFTLGMGPLGGGYSDLRTSQTIDLKVLPTKFTVAFPVGIFQMVGNAVNVKLNASVTNPDYPHSTSGYSFLWYCYEDGAEDQWAEDNVKLPSTARSIQIPTDTSNINSGGGGCFNTGPGTLLVADQGNPILNLNTIHMPVNKTYVVKVFVLRDGLNATAETRLQVESGTFYDLTIKCTGSNCLKKLNPAEDAFLTGGCADCPSNQPSQYNWKIAAWIGITKQYITEGLDLKHEHYKEGIFTIPKDTLTEGLQYVIELFVLSPNGARGKMTFEFYVNFKPRGGLCTTDISKGNSSTVFTLMCENWQDEGDARTTVFEALEGASFTYEHFYIDRGGKARYLAGDVMKLPSGDKDNDHTTKLKTRIIDKFRMAAEYFYEVQVISTATASAMQDTVSSLTNIDMSQVLLQLDSTLGDLTLVSNEIVSSLEVPAASTEDVAPPSFSTAYSPNRSPEDEAAYQQQQEKLKVVDSVMGMFVGMLSIGSSSSGDGEDSGPPPPKLSISQVINVAKSVESIPLPANSLPSTLGKSFDIVGSLDSFVGELDVDLSDPDSVSDATELLGTTISLTSNAMASSSSILVHEPQGDDVLTEAITDVGMTEEEEARQREIHAKKEREIAAVAATATRSVLSTVASITNVMTAMTVETRTMETPMLTVQVSALNTEKPINEQPIKITDSGKTESDIIFGGFDGGEGSKPVAQAVAMDRSLFNAKEGGDVDGPVLTISLNSVEEDGKINPLSGVAFEIEQIQVRPENISKNCSDDVTWDEDTGMVYLFANLTNNSAYHLLVEPEITEGVTITVYLVTGCVEIIECRPNTTFYNQKRKLPQRNLLHPWQATFNNVSDMIYIGIDVQVEGAEPGAEKPSLCTQTGVSKCLMYDSKSGAWDPSGLCTVSPNTTIGAPRCECSTPATGSSRRRRAADEPGTVAYSSGFTAPQVNPIDFKKIFDQFDELLGKNPAVFATVFVILGLYIALAIWARWSDRKDIEKWSVLPLVGNLPHSRNFYKLSVFTGLRRGAGTKSNICFILTGDYGDTGVMELKDTRNREFSTSSIRQFVLASEQDLGSLTFIRIWHDNSGKGDAASWYLEKIIVEDLQTKKRYYFLCGRWFAIDEDEGLVDRILPVAGRDEILTFNHLFFDKARRKLFDDHLWISLVGRPSRSNFSRLQRLTCILCLLFTTMVANAMWYGAAKVKNDKALKVGPITLSAATLLVSIYGGLTVIPINTIVMMLFRKHRPKEWPSDDEVLGVDGKRIKVDTVDTLTKKKKKKWWKGKYPLPYWCAYIGWVAAISCSIASMIIIIFYSLEWGKEKAEEWLSALFLSVIQSVILVQPIKVVFLAAILAMLFKTLDDDDEDVGERFNNGKAAHDEEFTDENFIKLNDLIKIRPPESLSAKQLAKARENRKYENQMWTLLKEGAFYFAFLLLICFIVWGSKNPLLFYTNNMLLEEMAGGSMTEFKETVTDWWAFWEWSQNDLVDNLFYMQRYNGRPGTPRDRQYLTDGTNMRVGPLVMRQVRVQPGSCRTVARLRKQIMECNDEYNMIDEEARNFSIKWHLDPRDNYTVDELSRAEQAFKYKSFKELKSMPYWGRMATYGGGGYVANLGTTRNQALKVLRDLLKNDWIDYYTRALFVEFTVYNPNINMFAYVNYLLESPATGAILPYPKIMVFQLYTRLSGMTVVVVACQVLYMLLIIYFMIREGFSLKRLGKNYWKNPWNYVEMIIIAMSWTAVALYMMREVVGRLVLHDLLKQKEKFTNFSLFAYYDEVYWYMIGIIVFLCNIKFLRLLRFNKHISQFAGTLKYARKDLMHFSVTFSLLFMAFTASGFLIFNRYTLDFNSVISVMESLYSMLVGKFDFREMEKADRILGPLYFVMFMVLMFFVVVNMFLGIIGHAYAQVCKNPELAGDEYKVVDFIMSKASKYLGLDKRNTKEETKYIDSMDSLNLRLEALDRLVTQDCRTVLGLEREALHRDTGQTEQATSKENKMEDDNKKVNKLAFLTKLQQSRSGTEPKTPRS